MIRLKSSTVRYGSGVFRVSRKYGGRIVFRINAETDEHDTLPIRQFLQAMMKVGHIRGLLGQVALQRVKMKLANQIRPFNCSVPNGCPAWLVKVKSGKVTSMGNASVDGDEV